MCKGHTLVAWNARSVLNKIEEVERILLLSNPEFIGICETWLTPNISNDEIELTGYNCIRADRTKDSGKSSGGGLLLYYKHGLKCTPMEDLTLCSPDIEMCWLKLSLTNTRPIYIGLVYRPPSGNHIGFLYELENVVTTLRAVGNCEINLYGDMNIDMNQSNIKTKQYKDHLRRLGLINTITQVTHIKQLDLGFSLLDHHLTTDPYLYQHTGAIATNASDHFFVFTVRKKPKAKHQKSKHTGRAYSKLKPEKFKGEILSHDWNEVMRSDDSNRAWSLFKQAFLQILHDNAPIKTFNDRDDRHPWVSTEFLERDDLQKQAKNSGTPIHKFLANRARNRTTSLKRELKRLFFRASIQEAEGDTKNSGRP